MTFTLTGRHLSVEPRLRERIGAKMRRLERLLNDSAISAQCVIGMERQVVACELNVHVRGGHRLHAVGRDRQAPAAVAAAVDKVVEQAQKLTGRWHTRRRVEAGRRPPAGKRASRT